VEVGDFAMEDGALLFLDSDKTSKALDKASEEEEGGKMKSRKRGKRSLGDLWRREKRVFCSLFFGRRKARII
jgi:hypothetical protein